ncbi:hypothetical protein A3E06_00890 [Candidatus Giovannonibacteria bacterium RIFCSPHIGHO2_12_FULL_44_42]|nr:MAG: hypothetical protein A3E06_00890 [Candidatus Giovannonibacteria bacterium RIFCSPHIGHO2_12_FULL_44_42]
MAQKTNAIKTFFDPHPGFAGATIPIPDKVKKVARKLNGKSMTLHQAVVKIQAVTNGAVSIENGWIALKLSESNAKHIFRVIRFR